MSKLLLRDIHSRRLPHQQPREEGVIQALIRYLETIIINSVRGVGRAAKQGQSKSIRDQS